MWYHEMIGGGRCPIVDTWWQTETGAIMITPLPGATPTKPGSATRPFFGVDAEVVKRDGTPCAPNEGGFLVIKQPWPSMLRADLRRPRALREARTGQRDPGRLLHRRRRAPRRGRLLLGHGPHRRRAQRRRHRLGTAEIESALVVAPGGRRGGRGRAAATSSRGRRSSRSSRLKPGVDADDELKKALSRARGRRRSARSRGPTRSASPTRCPRRARARSCGAC